MNRVAMAAGAALLITLLGCQQEESDDRLIQIAITQDKQKADIDRMSETMRGVENRLNDIEQSIEKVAQAAGASQPPAASETKTSEPKVVEFKDTPEYKQIVAQISAAQQQLSQTQGELAKTQEDAANQRDRARLRDPGEAFQAMNSPQEMNSRLDVLARNYAGKIADPMRRQQFEAEVEQLKRNLSQSLTPQQLYQQISADLAQRLNSEQNERAREFIQRQMTELQSGSGEDLQGRLDRYRRFQNFRQVRELQQKYDIPREAFQDAGLPAFGGQEGRGGRGDSQRPGGPRGRN